MVEGYYLLGKIYFERQEFTKADENLNRLFELSPDFSEEETNPDFKARVNAIRNLRKNMAGGLELELINVIKTNDAMDIAKRVFFSI